MATGTAASLTVEAATPTPRDCNSEGMTEVPEPGIRVDNGAVTIPGTPDESART
jgi:hypothetical protein